MVLSADGQTITTTLVRDGRRSQRPGRSSRRATPLPGEAPGTGGIVPLWDGRLLYETSVRGRWALWTMASDGTRRQRVTSERMDVNRFVAAARADVIVVETAEDLGAKRRLWRMDSNGGGLAELAGDGTEIVSTLSPDGAYLYYAKRAAVGAGSGFWRRLTAGGDAEQVERGRSVLPDGRLFFVSLKGRGQEAAGFRAPDRDRTRRTGGEDTHRSRRPANLRWAPRATRFWASASDSVRTSGDCRSMVVRPRRSRARSDEFDPTFIYTADGSCCSPIDRLPGEVVQFRNFR
jgi:hypothetical protein